MPGTFDNEQDRKTREGRVNALFEVEGHRIHIAFKVVHDLIVPIVASLADALRTALHPAPRASLAFAHATPPPCVSRSRARRFLCTPLLHVAKRFVSGMRATTGPRMIVINT